MHALISSVPVFAAFLAASFILAITPGPGVLYIVTRSATQGRSAGLASVAGVALGNLGNATAGTNQTVAMGGIFVLIAATTDTCYVIASGSVGPWLARGSTTKKVGGYVSAGTFIGLGLLAAFTGQRTRT